jgi:hypothetical protein
VAGGETPLGLVPQVGGASLIVEQREPGRAPRALAHALDALRPEPGERVAHRRAGEPPALGRGEMVADPPLDLADGGAERRQIGRRQPRQQPHDHEPAQMAGELGREPRQGPERPRLPRAVQARAGLVQDEQDPPRLGEGQPRRDRRRLAIARAAAVEEEPALLERADADAGAPAAPEQARDVAHALLPAREPGQPDTQRQRELGPGTQAGVGRDRLFDGDPQRRQAPSVVKRAEESARSVQLADADDLRGGRRSDADAGRQAIDGEAEAAEAPPEAAVEVEEAQVQAGGRLYAQRPGSLGQQRSSTGLGLEPPRRRVDAEQQPQPSCLCAALASSCTSLLTVSRPSLPP